SCHCECCATDRGLCDTLCSNPAPAVEGYEDLCAEVIQEFAFLGNLAAARPKVLSALGITHVVVFSEKDVRPPEAIQKPRRKRRNRPDEVKEYVHKTSYKWFKIASNEGEGADTDEEEQAHTVPRKHISDINHGDFDDIYDFTEPARLAGKEMGPKSAVRILFSSAVKRKRPGHDNASVSAGTIGSVAAAALIAFLIRSEGVSMSSAWSAVMERAPAFATNIPQELERVLKDYEAGHRIGMLWCGDCFAENHRSHTSVTDEG
ncbi:unnamed protein product, partial [Chrysoparadoxa australica]